MDRSLASTRTAPDFVMSAAELRARPGAKWSFHPPDVLPAWVADMDFRVAPPIQAALARLVEHNAYGYAPAALFDQVRSAFAERMAGHYGWQVDPAAVELTSEVVQGIAAALAAFTEPGDGVIVQTPIYPPFLKTVDAHRRRVVENRLVDDGRRYAVDLEDLRVAAAGARVLLLCNPHNPSGRVFTREELEGVAGVAQEHDLVIVSDEIHSDLVFSGHRHVPIASLSEEVAARTVTLTSATKAFNIAGARCAVAHFGSPELQARFREAIPEHVLGRVSNFGLEATLAAWREGQAWLDEVLVYLERNRDRVADWAADEASVLAHRPPEGTYLAWFDCSGLELGESSAQEFFLEAARVGLSKGGDFGAPGDACVRLNFATSAEILDQVLDRMAEAFMT